MTLFRKILHVLLLLIFMNIVFMSCSADIRTKFMTESNLDQKSSEIKGNKLLNNTAIFHGYDALRKIETYEVDFVDQYYGIYKYAANPYPDNITQLKLSYIPFSFNGKMEFLDGKWKNKIWGIQTWNTYSKEPASNIVIKRDKDIRFWLPTYQYFIEAPFRLIEGDICLYAGEKTFNNSNYDLVFVSWNTEIPQKDIDQYLVWINKETKRIDFLEFTVRDESKLIKAVAEYKDYKLFDDILFPSTIGIKMKVSSKKFIHKMSLKTITLNSVSKNKILLLDDIRNYYKH